MTIKIDMNNEKMTETLYKALLPETKVAASLRVRVTCERTNKSLLLVFHATDLISLRAAANSFLRLMYSIEKTLAVIK